MYGHEMFGFGWGYPLGLIGIALFWAVVILGVVALVRYMTGSRRQASPPDRGAQGQRPEAERILGERFARGEITEEEYRRALGTLRGDHAT